MKFQNIKVREDVSLQRGRSAGRGGKRKTKDWKSEWQPTSLKGRRSWSNTSRILEENHFSPRLFIILSMKCEIGINGHRVSVNYILLMRSSSGSYLLEYVFHQNEVIIQEGRWGGTQEIGAGIYQEKGERNVHSDSCSVGLESILYRFEEKDIEF